ncbi:uncharacterized protein LOC122388383 [Amphibalanus amphitrite]|uniref:uncharacterized protein LOC122388383 n=1 Tax=Amphibalanus amphitrite TaxID=1232801 RepID=UPI001C9146C5|nr:uncharacterized protein LOC122388383 [Amphibalanus amphitrite]
MTVGGRGRAAVGGILLTVVLLQTLLTGSVGASPVDVEPAALSSDQVLRRLAAWLDSEDAVRRQQRQDLDSVRQQLDKVALELERIETKMDLKMDRLQEVLIGRDIKEDATSRRQGAQLERTALLLTEVNGQLLQLDSSLQGNLDEINQKITTLESQLQVLRNGVPSDPATTEQITRVQQPAVTDDVTSSQGASDVTAALRRLADGMERLQCGDSGGSAADRTEGRGTAPPEDEDGGDAAGDTDQPPPESGAVTAGRSKTKGLLPALRLLRAVERQIFQVSLQLEEGLEWLDGRVGYKFRGLKENLATMASSLRTRFFERRDHLEEVAEKILRLQTAATDGQGADAGGDRQVAAHDSVITALEAILYDVFDSDMWYVLSTKLEEAVSGQGNVTAKLGQMESDIDQGFSKLNAKLTALYSLLKAPPDTAGASPDHIDAELAAQMGHMFSNISSQLRDIELKLAGGQTT